MSTRAIDFIGIGVVKAATSWIAQCMKEHPQICFPGNKEIKYFNRPDSLMMGIDWYLEHFQTCDAEALAGEYTPRYLHDNCAKEIHAEFPDTKLIVCLRNPSERAISHFGYASRKGNETAESLEDAVKHREDYITWGKYHRQLEPFLELFPREHILILFYEDIQKDPVAFMKQVYAFLGVDESFIPPSANTRKNVTQNVEYKFIGFNIFISKLKKALRSFGFGYKILFLIRKLGLSKISTYLLKANRRHGTGSYTKKWEPSKATYKWLHEYFSQDIVNLEKLTGRDLSAWK